MKKLKKIPKFKNEEQEFEFWSKNTLTNYFNIDKAKRIRFPNLRRTSKLVSMKMPISLIDQLKFLANKKDIAYQSLIKLFLIERLEKELRSTK